MLTQVSMTTTEAWISFDRHRAMTIQTRSAMHNRYRQYCIAAVNYYQQDDFCFQVAL